MHLEAQKSCCRDDFSAFVKEKEERVAESCCTSVPFGIDLLQ